jgi:DNA-binding response OmpR family regulator
LAPRASSRGQIRVLVVNVDTDVRELYRNVLLGDGVEVVEALDGRDALVQALSLRPHVAVVDARLPYIDGLELCALLRAEPLTQSTRLVLLTGDPSSDHVRRCRQRGADLVLVKPVPMDALANAVRTFSGFAPSAEQMPAAQSLSPPLPQTTHAIAKVRAHDRYVSTSPPEPPPALRCPQCDMVLQYERSHIGGVNNRHSEQWDYYSCARHGTFQYRHRTRRLRPAS